MEVMESTDAPDRQSMFAGLYHYWDYAQVLWINYVVGMNSRRQRQGITIRWRRAWRLVSSPAIRGRSPAQSPCAIANSPLGTFWDWYRRHWFSWRATRDVDSAFGQGSRSIRRARVVSSCRSARFVAGSRSPQTGAPMRTTRCGRGPPRLVACGGRAPIPLSKRISNHPRSANSESAIASTVRYALTDSEDETPSLRSR